MNRRKHLTIVVSSQLIGLALALWIQQSLVLSSVRQTAAIGSSVQTPEVLADLVATFWRSSGLTFVWCAAILSVVSHLLVMRLFEQFESQNSSVDVNDLKRTSALVRTQEAVIFGLAKLADSRDSETGDHLERISVYSSTIASALRRHVDFRDTITPTLVQGIGASSALHDIGKVGVEDAILRKPGPLTQAERLRMQTHTAIGEDCLLEIERRLGQSNFLRMAREIAAAHHERWDGRGYPNGLSGEQIPLAARIVAIADVYDALSTKRVYKVAMSHEQSVELIRSEAGGHFDPRLVAVFLEIEPLIKSIKQRFDAGGEMPSRIESQTPREIRAAASVPAVAGARARS